MDNVSVQSGRLSGPIETICICSFFGWLKTKVLSTSKVFVHGFGGSRYSRCNSGGYSTSAVFFCLTSPCLCRYGTVFGTYKSLSSKISRVAAPISFTIRGFNKGSFSGAPGNLCIRSKSNASSNCSCPFFICTSNTSPYFS